MKRLTVGEALGPLVVAGTLGLCVAVLGVAMAMAMGDYPWR